MISLSTAWNHSKHTTGSAIVDEIRGAGFSAVELNFALPEHVVTEIGEVAPARGMTVSSLHNMCPLPPEIKPQAASPDYYSLAATDETERERAVAAAKRTVTFAHRLGAKAVVLHLGRIPITDGTRELAAIADPGQRNDVRARIVRERDDHRDDHLEQAMRSLGDIAPYARERGIALGIENRYYYREIPIREELEIILRNFRRSNVYYWHDVGHAETFERLGLGRHRDLLRSFANRLLGIHLHDIIGPMGDHKAPGSGSFDFGTLEPYITRDTVKVIEVHQPVSADDLRRSVDYLTDIFTDKL